MTKPEKIGSAVGLEAGDAVWDKLTGEGPMIVVDAHPRLSGSQKVMVYAGGKYQENMILREAYSPALSLEPLPQPPLKKRRWWLLWLA